MMTMMFRAKQWLCKTGNLAAAFAITFCVVVSANVRADELTVDYSQVRAVLSVQDSVTPSLMKERGILGTAVGLSDTDEPALVIYADRDDSGVGQILSTFPPRIKGVAVKVHLTDKFKAFANTATQAAPIQLGTSGGWSKDLANGYCCGGTLGCLVQVNGIQS